MNKITNILLISSFALITVFSCKKQEMETVQDYVDLAKEYSPVKKVYVEKRVDILLNSIKDILSPILSKDENEKLNKLTYVYEENEREWARSIEYDKDKNLFMINLPSLNYTLKDKTSEVRDLYIDYLMVSRFLQKCFDEPYNFYESLHQFLIPELERLNKSGEKEIYNCKLFNDFERTNESFLLGLIIGKSGKAHSKTENFPSFLKQIKHLYNDHRYILSFKDAGYPEPKSENPYHEDNFSYPITASYTEKNNALYLGIHFANMFNNQKLDLYEFYKKASQSFQKFIYRNSTELNKDFHNCISNFSNINPFYYELKTLDKSKMDELSLYKLESELLEEAEKPKFSVDKIRENYKICKNQTILLMAYKKGLKYKNKLESALKGNYDKVNISKRLEAEMNYLDTAYVQKLGAYDDAYLNLWNKTPHLKFPDFNIKNSDKQAISIRFKKDKIDENSENNFMCFLGSSEYRNVYFLRTDVSEGKIIGEHVFNKSNSKASGLSTVLYYAYEKAKKASKNKATPLKTVESFNVSNKESRMIMDILLEKQILDLGEYRFDYDANSLEGIALLSTPNIKSCYWLAHDFKDEMENRIPKKVSIVRSKKGEIEGKSRYSTDLVVSFQNGK